MMGEHEYIRRQIEFIRVSKLPEARRDLSIDLVKQIFNEGRDVNDFIRESYTLLYLASLAGDMPFVKKLLDKGADVNLPSKGGETPLSVACEVGHPDIVEFLLDSGAIVDSLTDALVIACKHGHYEVFKVLLKKGNPMENDRPIRSFSVNSLLHKACLTGNIDIVNLLLEMGADFLSTGFVRIQDGPVFFSPNREYQNSLRRLRDFKWGEINWVANFPMSSLGIPYRTIWKGETGAYDDEQLNVFRGKDHVHTEKSSPFTTAIKRGHAQIVRLLLEKGGARLIVNYSGPDPIMLACEFRRFNVFRVLFEAYLNAYLRTEGLLVEEIFPDICFSYFNGQVLSMNALKDEEYPYDVYIGPIDVNQEKVDKYNSEIKEMKAIKVWNELSLYVVNQRYKDPYYLRNQDLMESLEEYLNSTAALEQFPLCFNILKNRFQSSKYKLNLLTRVSEALEGQEWWDKLPYLVQKNILSHLDNTDLEKISSSV